MIKMERADWIIFRNEIMINGDIDYDTYIEKKGKLEVKDFEKYYKRYADDIKLICKVYNKMFRQPSFAEYQRIGGKKGISFFKKITESMEMSPEATNSNTYELIDQEGNVYLIGSKRFLFDETDVKSYDMFCHIVSTRGTVAIDGTLYKIRKLEFKVEDYI